jgi:Mg2+ and Co2+ transporter CorA
VVRRDCTFMIETAEAIMSMLEAIQENLQDTAPTSPRLRKSTARAIAYRKRTFKSTVLRVYSLERRAQSIIQVYQALVTQADSHAMKFIAVLTLIFLPVTGVATVFSSPFFSVDFDADSTPLRVARCFWKFWAVVAPLTFGTCLLCILWFQFPNDFSFSHLFLSLRESLSVANWIQLGKMRKVRQKQGKLGV